MVREEAVSYTAETPVVPADFAVDGIAEEKPVEKVETPLQKQAFFHNYKIIGQIFRTILDGGTGRLCVPHRPACSP